ncbi:hypothetical protein WH299_24480 [Pseudomonas sp. MYb541]|uniref:hypothetical protein n=1 Tax=Pseudomonas sp. MYb541 TaxID=2745402 RepID=UPI0030A6F22E
MQEQFGLIVFTLLGTAIPTGNDPSRSLPSAIPIYQIVLRGHENLYKRVLFVKDTGVWHLFRKILVDSPRHN